VNRSSAKSDLVSVVVRTKDRPRLLAQALDSLAKQTHQPLEAVVVNDGGAGVEDVVGAFAGRVTYRLVDLHPGRGRSAAANAGIAAAVGAWIAFLDDDDLLVPDGVATLVAAAEGRECVPYGRVDAYFHPADAAPRLFRVFNHPFDASLLLFENYIPFNACLIPAALLRALGGLDERLECFEDWDLFLRLSDRVPFRHVDDQVAEYRIFDQAFITGRGGQEHQHRGRVAVFTKHAHRYTPEALSRMQYAVKVDAAAAEHAAAALESSVRERDARLTAGSAELADVTRRLDEAERTLKAIESSRGWRLVQGVRRLLSRR